MSRSYFFDYIERRNWGLDEKQIEGYYWYRTFGQTIKEWREYRGLSATELCQRTNGVVSQSYLSSLESGRIKGPPHNPILYALGSALNVSVLLLILHLPPPNWIEPE